MMELQKLANGYANHNINAAMTLLQNSMRGTDNTVTWNEVMAKRSMGERIGLAFAAGYIEAMKMQKVPKKIIFNG